MEKGIRSDKLYFDPLILPVTADQTQAVEALSTLRMIKESFEPQVKNRYWFVKYFKWNAIRFKAACEPSLCMFSTWCGA